MRDLEAKAVEAAQVARVVTDPAQRVSLLELAASFLRLSQHRQSISDLKAKVVELTGAAPDADTDIS